MFGHTLKFGGTDTDDVFMVEYYSFMFSDRLFIDKCSIGAEILKDGYVCTTDAVSFDRKMYFTYLREYFVVYLSFHESFRASRIPSRCENIV